MLAARLYGPNDLRVENVPVPKIGAGQILLRVKACGICGTDLRMYLNGTNAASNDHPMTLGHEFAGIIEEVAPDVEGYATGMRVAIAPNFGCGHCKYCVRGDSHICSELGAVGINLDGGFAQYVLLDKNLVLQGNVVPLPDGVSFAEAAVNEAVACVYNGEERNMIKPGDNVLIIGAGFIGQLHGKLASMFGASTVTINDISEDRLKSAKKNDPFINTMGSANLKEQVMDFTDGEGMDVVVTACPIPAVQQLALELGAYNARINFFGGLPASKQLLEVNTNLIHYKQLIVTGTTRANNRHFRTTLGFMKSGMISISKYITGKFALVDTLKGIETAIRAEGLKNIVTI